MNFEEKIVKEPVTTELHGRLPTNSKLQMVS